MDVHGEESSASHDLIGDEKLAEEQWSTREESSASFMFMEDFKEESSTS